MVNTDMLSRQPTELDYADPSKFKFTIPDYDLLAKSLQELGIGDPFHIILYSGNGIQWATRVWWLIFVLGFKKVSILDF